MISTEAFRDAIAAAGLTPPDHIVGDGKLRRFAGNGNPRDDSAWYVLFDDARPAGEFGDWRTDFRQTWRADTGREWSDAERTAHREKIAAAKREREAEEARRRKEAASKAARLWKAAAKAGEDHPYLRRKGVAPVETLRELPAEAVAEILGYTPQARGEALEGRLLIAPVKIGDRLSTCELIAESGRKSAVAGGAKAGGFWATEALPEGDGDGLVLLVGEGVATCLSAREATGHPAVAALSCGNLAAVGRAMRERYPKARLAVLADLGNGEEKAAEAARECGVVLVRPDFGGARPDGASDFNDLAAARGLDAVRDAINGALEQAQASANAGEGGEVPGNDGARMASEWPAPLPLAARLEPEPYPLDALPSTLRAAVDEVQSFVQAPVALVASAALAALSVAAQSHVDVKRLEKLSGPVGLYLLMIADSGERKSTVDGFFTSALRRYQEEQAEAARPAIERHEAEMDAWNSERDGLLSAIKDCAKKGKATAKLRDDLAELQRHKPEPPRVPSLLMADETPENLAWRLAKQWPAGGVLSSEAGLVLGAHGMGKDSVMRNLALLNLLWDGGVHSIGRRTSESFTVKGARLTVALQIQEPTLRAFFEKSGALARGTGFLARFLIAWPESTQGTRRIDPDRPDGPASWPHLAAFHRRIDALLAAPVPIREDGSLEPAMLTTTPEAKGAWVAFANAIEGELSSGGELYDVRDCASKAADNVARLAALLQVFEGGIGAVGVEALESASRIVAWHLSESRRFFGELALPAELADASRLDAWLLSHCRANRTGSVSTREAQRLGPGGVRDRQRLDAALAVLEETARARIAHDGRRRIICINPALLDFAGPA